MIKELEVEIVGHRTNFNHYKSLGYDIKYKQKVVVSVKHLMSGSTALVTTICDNCFASKKTEYKEYFIYTNSLTDPYYCRKCNSIKRKETSLSKWGVENPMQSSVIKEKLKSSIKETYGVDHYSKTEDWKEKYKNTCLDNWGVDNASKSEVIKDRIRETNNKKFGVDYPQQHAEIKEKTKTTFLNKFGHDRYSQTDEFIWKVRETSQKKWGVDNFSQTEDHKTKTKESSQKKWGVDHFSKTDEFKLKVKKGREILTKMRYDNLIGDKFSIIEYNNSIFNILHTDCNREFYINRDMLYQRLNLNICICTKCLEIFQSSIEFEMQQFLNELGISYNIKDKTILSGKELDIYLPEYNLAIEMNGVYWHSEIYLDRGYHRDKTLRCRERGINLLHIWEDDWKLKRNIVKSIILNKISKIDKKIFARKCRIEIIDSRRALDFLEENHIQGKSASGIKLGLIYGDELVSLMTFGFRYTNGKREFELIRFCNKINTNVIGAASKLFSHFLKTNQDVDRIVSYSDISLFVGGIYRKLGFDMVGLSQPNYFWVVDGVRKHRFLYNKKRLIKMGFQSQKSESEIMHESGYFRVYSCGQEKWIYKVK